MKVAPGEIANRIMKNVKYIQKFGNKSDDMALKRLMDLYFRVKRRKGKVDLDKWAKESFSNVPTLVGSNFEVTKVRNAILKIFNNKKKKKEKRK